jgi:hypothetical protein
MFHSLHLYYHITVYWLGFGLDLVRVWLEIQAIVPCGTPPGLDSPDV